MFSPLQLNAGNLAKFIGSIGPFATVTGALVAGNVPIETATGIADSGVQLLTSLPATTVWGNNTSGAAPPAALTVLTLGNGTKTAPTYSFNASTGTGIFSSGADVLDLAAGGNVAMRLRSTDATSFLEYIYSGRVILRAAGATNGNFDLAAVGTGEVNLAANGGSTNGVILRLTPSGTAGSANNYLRLTTGQTGANPTLTVVAQASGDTNIGLDFTPTGTGIFRNTATYFHARALVSIAAGDATQAFVKASNTADLGKYYGTGDPSFSAAKGSTYSKTDAAGATDRFWINTNGSTGWTNYATGLQNVQSFMSGDVSLNNTANFFNGPNTGSIGAAGQIWLISAMAQVEDSNVAGASFLARIHDGTNPVSGAFMRTAPTASSDGQLTMSAIVTLSAATTFTLQVRDASFATGTLFGSVSAGINATVIQAIRLS